MGHSPKRKESGLETTEQPTRPRRVRFFLDPSLSDSEIARRLIEMAEELFDFNKKDGPRST